MYTLFLGMTAGERTAVKYEFHGPGFGHALSLDSNRNAQKPFEKSVPSAARGDTRRRRGQLDKFEHQRRGVRFDLEPLMGYLSSAKLRTIISSEGDS